MTPKQNTATIAVMDYCVGTLDIYYNVQDDECEIIEDWLQAKGYKLDTITWMWTRNLEIREF